MKIVDVAVFPLSLPMAQQFSISGGVVGNPALGAPHVYVRIRDECGCEGWGEARPSHRWSYETIESVCTTIRNYFCPLLIGCDAVDIQTILRTLNQQIANGTSLGQPIAKAAIDIALHDLIGKHRHERLCDTWMSPFINKIQLSYLISTLSPEEAAMKAQYAADHAYQAVDVKVGHGVKLDTEILEAVKSQLPNAFLRVDANQGYQLPQAIELCKVMDRIGVDVFEQPLSANNLTGHAELRRRTNVPIALDESIWGPRDLIQALRLEACDYAVIKVTKMGGLVGAKLCGELAREAQLGLLGGGLTESSIGLAASGHLFNYLGIQIPVDLNGPIFLRDDPVERGPFVQDGTVTLLEEYGVGYTISGEKLQRYQADIKV